jgi:hypothetical protein
MLGYRRLIPKICGYHLDNTWDIYRGIHPERYPWDFIGISVNPLGYIYHGVDQEGWGI